jgi:hypothetical protein
VCTKEKAKCVQLTVAFSFDSGVNRRYGLTILICGQMFFASSVFTLGWTMTSSPGCQLIGVVTLCLSPVCRESIMRRSSLELRPVEAGYDRIVRMVFLGSMTKTDRIVKAWDFSVKMCYILRRSERTHNAL